MKLLLFTLSALVLLMAGLSPACADELRVMTSAAQTEAYNELIPEFERATQSKVVTSFGGDDIPKRLAGGEPADLVIIWRADLEKLVTQQMVTQGSEVDLVRSSIGAAVRVWGPHVMRSSFS